MPAVPAFVHTSFAVVVVPPASVIALKASKNRRIVPEPGGFLIVGSRLSSNAQPKRQDLFRLSLPGMCYAWDGYLRSPALAE